MSTAKLTPQAAEITKGYEPRPDVGALNENSSSAGKMGSAQSEPSGQSDDYEPHPERSLALPPERQRIVDAVTALYSGSASESDMQVYAQQAIYDDPWSYCDTRLKIAGQWYGIPKVMASSKTLATEIVQNEPNLILFKLRQEYTPRVVHFSKPVNSLISLSLDDQGKIKYHKDQWNGKDYSHEGLGKIMKTLNGDHLPKITSPPKSL